MKLATLKQTSRQFGKYCIVGGIGYLLNLGLLFLMVEAVHVHYLIAAAVVPAFVVLFNFTLNKTWTFRGKET